MSLFPASKGLVTISLSLSLSRASISCFTVWRQGTQTFNLRAEYNKIYPALQRLHLLACNTAVYQRSKETRNLRLEWMGVIGRESNLLTLDGVASAYGNLENRSHNHLKYRNGHNTYINCCNIKKNHPFSPKEQYFQLYTIFITNRYSYVKNSRD